MSYFKVDDVLGGSSDNSAAQAGLVVQGRRSHDGKVMFINVNDLVEAANGLDIGAQPATAVADRAIGYPRPGPGRKKGTSLQVHESVRYAILVLLATSTYLNLTDLLEPEDVAQVDLAVLQELRQSHSKVTHQALRMKAWDLSRSVAIGVILKYGPGGSRDREGRHQAMAVEAKLTSTGIICTCSAPESCLAV